jgi:hypothetical protein
MADGALAIGAGNMDGFELIFWMPQVIAQPVNIIEIILVGGSAYTAEHGQACEKIVQCLLVSHSGRKLLIYFSL